MSTIENSKALVRRTLNKGTSVGEYKKNAVTSESKLTEPLSFFRGNIILHRGIVFQINDNFLLDGS
jgi:hypothetical protein